MFVAIGLLTLQSVTLIQVNMLAVREFDVSGAKCIYLNECPFNMVYEHDKACLPNMMRKSKITTNEALLG